MSVQPRKYDSDFKRNAVQLIEESGCSVKDVAENLGINKDLLYRWGREHNSWREGAFPGRGKEALTDQGKRIHELEKKLKDAEMERDILKKAMPIFSRAPK